MQINQDEFEKVFFRALIEDSNVWMRLGKFLQPDIFKNKNFGKVLAFYKNFFNENKSLPSTTELKVFAQDVNFLETLRNAANESNGVKYSEIDKNLFYKSAEQYLKEKLALKTLNAIVDNWGKSPVEPHELVSQFEKVAQVQVTQEKSFNIYDDVDRYIKQLDSNQKRLPTGFKLIDEKTGGGVLAEGKCLAVISAPTNVGKSIMLGNLAVNAAKRGKNVLIISLEMSEMVYANRIYSALYGMKINYLSCLKEEIKQNVLNNRYGNINIKEFPPSTMTVEDIEAYLETERNERNEFPYDLICIDYLSLLTVNKLTGKNSNEVGKEVARKLRALTYKYNVPIWTACQINREGTKNGLAGVGPENSDVAESFAIPQECDLMLSLFQQPEDKEMNIMRVKFLKSRLGPMGFTINLYYNQEILAFEDIENDGIIPESITQQNQETTERKSTLVSGGDLFSHLAILDEKS